MKQTTVFAFIVNLSAIITLSIIAATGKAASDPISSSDAVVPTASAPGSVRFAIIGDYGMASAPEANVAALVQSWNPDFVITTGDNNYPSGSAGSIDQNIGQYYHNFIGDYTGSYGSGSPKNQFYPSLGNHDLGNNPVPNPQSYLDYFTLPDNERYYQFAVGPARLFVLDSDPRNASIQNDLGNPSVDSEQGIWLQSALANAVEPWKIVTFHHPPYSSSSTHGSTKYMQWNFKGWGADIVINGHDHAYERLSVDGFPYIVNGSGGASLYGFKATPVTGSLVRYNANYGAMFVQADSTGIQFQFINRAGKVIDTFSLGKTSAALPDLTLLSARVELDNPICFQSDNPLGTRVWISNNGSADADAFVVKVNAAEQTIDQLAAGETTSLFFAGYASIGEPTDILIDVNDQIGESDESNNLISQNIAIPTAPPPCVTSIPTSTSIPTPTLTPSPNPVVTIRSNASQDGTILEKSESANSGYSINSIESVLSIGDDAIDRQYRAVLSFATGSQIPDDAIITRVVLRLKKYGSSGSGNPLDLFDGLIVDVRLGFFGSTANLSAGDFQSAANDSLGPFEPSLIDTWYNLNLTAAKDDVNKFATKAGLTQIRLRFVKGDNDNQSANILKFYSSNTPTFSNRPVLIVEYYVP